MIVDVALGMRAYPIHIAPGLLGPAAPLPVSSPPLTLPTKTDV